MDIASLILNKVFHVSRVEGIKKGKFSFAKNFTTIRKELQPFLQNQDKREKENTKE